jgi:peroxiredoxin
MITTSLLAGMLFAAIPAVGDLAPDFTAKDTEGKDRNLSSMLKQGPVIVAFFSKAFTGG